MVAVLVVQREQLPLHTLESCNGDTFCVLPGSVAPGVQLPLHAMSSFEELNLSQSDAIGCAEIGPSSSPRSAPSLFLCWRPEGFLDSGGASHDASMMLHENELGVQC